MIGLILMFLIFIILILIFINNEKSIEFENYSQGIYSFSNNKNYNFPLLNYRESSPKNKKLIRIITNVNSQGLKYDAIIYNKLLNNSNYNSYVLYYKNIKDIPDKEKYKFCDVNIYMENLFLKPDKLFLKAKQYWLVINQEFFCDNMDDLQFVNKFLCKTKYATQLMHLTKQKYNLKGDIIFIGHTSICNNNNLSLNNKKINLFIHTAGKSWLKNTKVVIDAWKLIHQKYPNNYLVVTCKHYCKIVNNCTLSSCKNDNYKNGIIYKDFFEEKEYNTLLSDAICCIYPSFIEGFGHCINEGRANGCAIITVDGAPMNELVIENKNGLLVKNPEIISSHKLTDLAYFYFNNGIYGFYDSIKNKILNKIKCINSSAYIITTQQLFDTIEKFILLSDKEKLDMCVASRKMYLNDNFNFQNNLLQLLK